MVRVIVGGEVVDIRGSDDRPADLGGDPCDPLVCLVLLGDPVDLKLEVDVLGPEDLDQVVDVGARLGRVVVDQPAAEARCQAAGQRDHALGVLGEQVEVDVGLAAPQPLEEAGRRQLDQVLEAGIGLGEQRQVVALELDRVVAHVVDEIGLEAQDRLDPVLLARFVELQGPVHDAVVGQPEGRLAQFGGPLGERVDPAGAVQQRVLRVDVQVDGRRGHGPTILGRGADG